MINRKILVFLTCMLLVTSTHAARIKDVTKVAGVRSNQLIGYGLVTGLPGTGESTAYTEQTFGAMLQKFGIQLPEGTGLDTNNIAAVLVTAKMPAFTKQGQNLDVTISSIGSAESLRGGTLVQTFLKGLDGEVYAIAQGNLLVSSFSEDGADGSNVIVDNPTVGIISNGATVEREIPSPFSRGDHITFNLMQSDFTTAQRMVEAINQFLGPNMASAVDSSSIKVRAPRDVSQRVAFLSTIENLEFETATSSAKIIVNSRTGTIVVGEYVKLKPAAITHGGMTVAINEVGADEVIDDLDAPEEVGRMFKFEAGLTLNDLVRAVNEVGAAPSDLMAILQALKQAGAIEGQLVVI